MNKQVLKTIRIAAKTLEAEGKTGICEHVEKFLIAGNLNQSPVFIKNTEIQEIVLYAARILGMDGDTHICKNIRDFFASKKKDFYFDATSTEGLLINISLWMWTQQMLKIRFNGEYVFPNALEFAQQVLQRLNAAKVNKGKVLMIAQAILKACIVVIDPFSKKAPKLCLPS